MRFGFLSLVLLGSIFFSICGLAKQPIYLAGNKYALVHYHDSGKYDKDIARVVDHAQEYLANRIAHGAYHGKKPAIVIDIDETALSNYSDLFKADFSGTIEEALRARERGLDPVIPAVFKLYQFAKAHHVSVFFITGRIAEERSATIINLREAGYRHWDGLILRSPQQENIPAKIYKTTARKQLIKQGYDILLNIGDQYSDLRGGYADKTFKLPNPFYVIP